REWLEGARGGNLDDEIAGMCRLRVVDDCRRRLIVPAPADDGCCRKQHQPGDPHPFASAQASMALPVEAERLLDRPAIRRSCLSLWSLDHLVHGGNLSLFALGYCRQSLIGFATMPAGTQPIDRSCRIAEFTN